MWCDAIRSSGSQHGAPSASKYASSVGVGIVLTSRVMDTPRGPSKCWSLWVCGVMLCQIIQDSAIRRPETRTKRQVVMVGRAVTRPAAIPERSVTLSCYSALQYQGLCHRHTSSGICADHCSFPIDRCILLAVPLIVPVSVHQC